MNVFILADVGRVSDNYHGEGGLVVIADHIEAAKALAATSPGCTPTDTEWASATVIETRDNVSPQIFVFPNAGCC